MVIGDHSPFPKSNGRVTSGQYPWYNDFPTKDTTVSHDKDTTYPLIIISGDMASTRPPLLSNSGLNKGGLGTIIKVLFQHKYSDRSLKSCSSIIICGRRFAVTVSHKTCTQFSVIQLKIPEILREIYVFLARFLFYFIILLFYLFLTEN